MRFMMFVVTDSTPDVPADESDVSVWVDELAASGQRVLGDVLRPVADAKVVRVRDGDVFVTDGPFEETTEVICGFDVLEAPDMGEAIQIAARHPMARNGRLELRAFAN